MIEIDGNKTNTISFNLNMSGTTKTPVARLMIPINEQVSIAFPAEIKDGKAVVEIQPLRKYVDKVYDKVENAVLEVIIGETLFYPWKGDFKITNIMIVEAEDPVVSNANISHDVKTETSKVLIKERSKTADEKKSAASDYL